ncbi:trypco2 family protein [Streptomyces sp. NPDC050392]|uniref:trypco2 family protein n=1 Tax=Streptomyces sp. NPDC050392 TaxID=3155782 RepID=UPI003441D750
MSDGLRLSEVLASLRRELAAAHHQRDPLIPLEVKEIEVELTVEVARQTAGEAGVSWLVVAKGSKNSASTTSHRLTLTLGPGFVDFNGNRGELLVTPSVTVRDDD